MWLVSGIALNKYRLFVLSVLIPVKADCTIVPDFRNGGPSEWRTQTVLSGWGSSGKSDPHESIGPTPPQMPATSFRMNNTTVNSIIVTILLEYLLSAKLVYSQQRLINIRRVRPPFPLLGSPVNLQ